VNIQTGYGSQVRITCVDGTIVEGFYSIYTRAGDNEPEIASVTIETPEGFIEVYENKIKSIEILN
jgi:hypothetical protein